MHYFVVALHYSNKKNLVTSLDVQWHNGVLLTGYGIEERIQMSEPVECRSDRRNVTIM